MNPKYLYWYNSPVYHDVKKYVPSDPERSYAWCGQTPFTSGGDIESKIAFTNKQPLNKTKCKGCILKQKAKINQNCKK